MDKKEEENEKNRKILEYFYEKIDQETQDKYGTFYQYSSIEDEESEEKNKKCMKK